MNSVSRPQSAFNRLGSFTSLGVKGSINENKERDSILHLADIGYIFKQSHQINHAFAGNSRAQINQLIVSHLKDKQYYEKYFGTDNRMLNGYMTGNVQLSKSLNY